MYLIDMLCNISKEQHMWSMILFCFEAESWAERRTKEKMVWADKNAGNKMQLRQGLVLRHLHT